MSEDRKQKLHDIGLLDASVHTARWDVIWNRTFERLNKFQEEHGHVAVPHLWKEDGQIPQLGQWVKAQRRLHKNGQLKEDRRQKLDDIGLLESSVHIIWNRTFERLEKFQEEHGHVAVPQSWKEDGQSPHLGLWVTAQRRLHKNGQLKEERFQKLDDLGFVWHITKSGRS